MIKPLIVLSALASVLGQEYDFTNNLVDFDDTPYQRSLPYSNNDDRNIRLMNIRSKPIKNAIVMNNGFEVVKRPANSLESREVNTSLSNIQTSVTATLTTIATKFLWGLKTGLKLLKTSIPALIFGAIMTIGFCKITSLCTKFSSIQSLTEAVKEYSAFLTPERLDTASEFIQEAVRRYEALQAD